jgi:multicomponent Na+:H+ antiporter subunit D
MIESIESVRPVLALCCPLTAAFLILASRKHPNLREGWTMLAAVAQFLIILSLVFDIRELDGGVIEYYLFTILPGVDFGFKIDAFGLIFAITSGSLWILVSSYSIGYMRSLHEHAQTRYYFCFALAILGAEGVAMSANLLTMFIFYEVLTVSTYPLVAHDQTDEALFGGRKYLAYLLTAGVFFLAAVLLTYSFVGTTDFRNGGILSADAASAPALVVLFFFFMLGFIKAAWMPFHSWLPTAMVAPTPVSALLHAVAVVKAGVFCIVRVVCYIYGVDLMSHLGLAIPLATIAGFTMLTASLFAIAQDNLKRRLAYSTISQLSYIIFGVSLLTPMGIQGAMLHIPFHGFMKITLFMCAGSIMVASGKKNISEMGGIGRIMPFTMFAFTIGALGMAGAPPVCGFVSKWYMCVGTLQADKLVLLAVLLISSLLDIIYFFPIIYTAFFGKPKDVTASVHEWKPKIKESSPFMVAPLVITAICSIIFCIPNPVSEVVLSLARIAVTSLGGAV